MEGYQFGHIELWSNKAKSGDGAEPQAVRKNGQRKWTAQEILDEAERIASASAHVIPGRPGPQIFPRAAATFEDMRKMQEAASQVQETYIRQRKGKEPVEVTRKLRKDAATLYASVFSLPVLTEDALSDPNLKRQAVDVLEQALAWEDDRISKAGGVVLAGVIHWDEEYLHIHVFAADPLRGRADLLHPGRVAKDAVNKSGKEKSKARGKLANIAYCDAMRAWQDELHAEVFAQAGLLRIGPARNRWSRKDYGRAKALQRDIASREKRIADLEAWECKQERRQETQDAREKELGERYAEIARRENEAAVKARKAESVKTDADALRKAINSGSRAVANRELDYREPTEKQKEGLKFGPGASKSKKKRERLIDVIRPAYDIVLGLAKKAFFLRRREAEVKRREAQNRKAAMALAEERQRVGLVVPKTLAQIAAGEALPLDRGAFPDALFVARGANAAELQKQLDEMTNVSIRRAWVATWQSIQICDGRPDLSEELGRGAAVLEEAARMRGYDLESGKHLPQKATDLKRSQLHVDTEPAPIRIVRRNKQRVLTRT